MEITMIEVFAFATPNSVKVPIALEEMGLDYRLVPVNLRQGEQKTAAFKEMNLNAKVPVLVDRAPKFGGGKVVLSESAAILVYLAEKSGQLLPSDGARRGKVFEQLFFHASGLSPAFLQAFLVSIQSSQPEAKERALAEVDRALGVLNHVLEQHEYVAGNEYSIADIAHFGWIWRHQAIGASLDKFPNVRRWYSEVSARSAVVAAIAKTLALAQ
jgi:GST-like protein